MIIKYLRYPACLPCLYPTAGYPPTRFLGKTPAACIFGGTVGTRKHCGSPQAAVHINLPSYLFYIPSMRSRNEN